MIFIYAFVLFMTIFSVWMFIEEHKKGKTKKELFKNKENLLKKIENKDHLLEKFKNKKLLLIEIIEKELNSNILKNKILTKINELELDFEKNINYLKKSKNIKLNFKLKKELKMINNELDNLINKIIDINKKEKNMEEIENYINIIKKDNKDEL